MSVYLLGSFPRDTNVHYLGTELSNTSVKNGAGGGLKVGIFPAVAHRIIGVEFESFAHVGRITFPLPAGLGAGSGGSTNLLIFNSMVNLIARYPGTVVQPYVGIGAGLSQGVLVGADIPGRADRDFEGSPTLGHQFLAGIQTTLSERSFLFMEYKYLSANYHWAGISLDFRAHYALLGIGLRF